MTATPDGLGVHTGGLGVHTHGIGVHTHGLGVHTHGIGVHTVQGSGEDNGGQRISVTGPVYSADGSAPTVTLYTKFQCTLCDKVGAEKPYCMHVCVDMRMYTCMYVFMYIYIYMCVCVSIHVYI